MQSEKIGYSGIYDILKSMVGSRGVKSLYIGWAPTVLRDVPFSGISTDQLLSVFYLGLNFFSDLLGRV